MKRIQSPEVSLNLSVRRLGKSATLAINEKSNEMIRQGRKIYKFGLGQSPFPVPEVVVEELKRNASKKDYLPVNGLEILRKEIASYYKRTEDIEFSPDNILVGPGSKELMFILQLAYYGDLMIPSPSWVSYEPQAKIIGRNVIWMDTTKKNNWLLQAEEIEYHCRNDISGPRLIILNYPNNPTGKTYSKSQLKKIAYVARKYKIVLLSDEIYGGLHHKGEHSSIAKFYPEGTIISSGLSKWCGAGGWRLGTFAFPEELSWLLKGMTVIASETFTSTNAPVQYAAVKAFSDNEEINKYLKDVRVILKSLSDYIYRKYKRAKISVAKPNGGFYFFLDFSNFSEGLKSQGISDSADLCNRILNETGAAILPGVSFGRPKDEFTARMAYVNFDGEKALKYLVNNKIEHQLKHDELKVIAPELLEGVDILCDWVGNL